MHCNAWKMVDIFQSFSLLWVVYVFLYKFRFILVSCLVRAWNSTYAPFGVGLASKIPKIFPEFLQKCSKISVFTSKNPIKLLKISKNPIILKIWVTCGEHSMALVGFLLAPSVSANQQPINKLCWARHF